MWMACLWKNYILQRCSCSTCESCSCCPKLLLWGQCCQFHLRRRCWPEEADPCAGLTAGNSTSTVNTPKSPCCKLTEAGGQNDRQKAHTMWKLIKGFYKDFRKTTRPENSRDLYKLTGKHEQMALWHWQLFSSFLVVIKIINLLCIIPPYSTLPPEHLFFASHQVLCRKTSILTITNIKKHDAIRQKQLNAAVLTGGRFNVWARRGARLTCTHIVNQHCVDSHCSRNQQLGPTGSNRPPIPSLFLNATDYSL